MVAAFSTNTKRYVSLFEEVIQEIMPKRTLEVPEDDVNYLFIQEIRYKCENILENQRMDNIRETDPRTRQ